MSSSEENLDDLPLESPISSPEPGDSHRCPSCGEKMKQPMVLACLHVFCLDCLQKQVDENNGNEGQKCTTLECQKCSLETEVPEKGLSGLTPEYVLMDLMEMSNVEDTQLICTSCKAKEQAVARCQDCANFLCPNCVTAHQFMRCFENHKVISCEDMKKGDPTAIHKPIYCTTHHSEVLKYYCKTCQVPICNDCMVGDHKPPAHQPERIQEMEEGERENLLMLVTNCKKKAETYDEKTSSLMNSFQELESFRDNAKDLINETFQSYKAVLEKRRDELLAELDSLQSSKELALMELCHNVEKSSEKLVESCNFTEHILNNGSGVQILLMKGVMTNYLSTLLQNTLNPDVPVNIEFVTDSGLFEQSVKNTFGTFKKEDSKAPERPSSSLHSSFENEGFNLQSGIISPDTTIMPPLNRNYFMSMTPNSEPSSNLVDFNCPTFANLQPGQLISRSRSTMEGRSDTRNSHSPAMSDSGISMDAGSTNSNSSVPLVNIAALAKLGTVAYSTQGMGGLPDTMTAPGNSQLTFNGQVVPGWNSANTSAVWNSASSAGMPPVPSRGRTPVSEIGPPRPQTPSLETLAGLLNQNQPALDGSNFFGLGGGMGGAISSNPGNVTPTLSLNNTLSDSASSMNTIGSSSSLPVRRATKMSAMQIRCKFGQLGPGKGQFNSPHGFCLGQDEDIIVADTNNHRIQVFEKSGELKFQFGIPGREEGQMWYPRKVAVIRSSGKFIVCDRGNERSRMQIFNRKGMFYRKIAIRYVDIVAGLAISAQGHIVAVDSVSPTVFCISESGELIKWFDCSEYMREPSDIAISGKEYFVCDFKGHCVAVFNEDGLFQRRIGCENITNYPNGIDISDAGDVLVGDSHGNRFHVAVFQRDGSLIGEFECPYVKVSRCCGLKITSEGYVVTLAKNNHHVLVLNTLYIS